MAKKLYTIKDIVELLNKDLEKNEQDYRYTEQSIRSRLRYLRSKGVEDHEQPIITPQVFGYDKRTKYYTEEDVEKLKTILIGPMLPEFQEDEEGMTNSEELEEIEVRPAVLEDLEAIEELSKLKHYSKGRLLHNPIFRMLKEPNSKTFVAVSAEEQIIGWGQGRISFAMSITNDAPVGTIHFYISNNREDRLIAATSLIHRIYRWLILRDTKKIYLEIPSQIAELEEHFRNLQVTGGKLNTILLP